MEYSGHRLRVSRDRQIYRAMHSESDSERIQLSVNDIYRRLRLDKDLPVACNAQLRVFDDKYTRRTLLRIGCSDSSCEDPLKLFAARSYARWLDSEPEDNDLLDTDVCGILREVIAAVISCERDLVDRLRRFLRCEVAVADTDALALLRGLLSDELAPHELAVTVRVRLSVIKVELAACAAIVAESNAEREGILLHQWRGATGTLPRRDDRTTADEERDLVELGRNSDFLAF